MLVHRRVAPRIKFADTHLYTSVERDTASVKCLTEEHNRDKVPGQGSRPDDLIRRRVHKPWGHRASYTDRSSIRLFLLVRQQCYYEYKTFETYEICALVIVDNTAKVN